MGASGARGTVGATGNGVYYTAASHGRRLAAHQGHCDPLGFLIGLATLWVMARTLWGVVTGG